MGDKKERSELVQAVFEKMPEFLEAYLPQYMEEHRAELKRWFLNTDGFRSQEECKESERQKEKAEQALKEEQARHVETKATLERTKDTLLAVQKECADVRRHADDVDEEMNRLMSQATQKIEEAHKAQRRAEAVRDHYEASYARAEDIVRTYHAIPDDIRQGLHSFIGDGEDVVLLLARLSQQEILRNLWEYAMHQIVHGALGKSDVEALARLVEISLQLVNAGRTIFAVQDIRIGDRFQPNEMQKTPESRQQGTVKAILLPGYAYQESGKIVEKSLVEVE